MLHEQVIVFMHGSGGGILHRQNAVIGPALPHSLHHVGEGGDEEGAAVRVLGEGEKNAGRLVGIGTRRSPAQATRAGMSVTGRRGACPMAARRALPADSFRCWRAREVSIMVENTTAAAPGKPAPVGHTGQQRGAPRPAPAFPSPH